MKRFLLLPALILPLAACQMADEGASSGAENDLCSASAHQDLVGADRAAVAAAGLEPGPKTRIIGPGHAVTMDFRVDRINVELDENDRVIRVYCG
ncbi:hypothetical protein OB2597_10781 [Pseudooceanicola batsensis HTCC2597]|uniref:Lipoprotein n=1 Tax=Pseudooceanicola batsensis (strain ATCC BAA-863 / DSM 15984 / KCTC 12145 / HTCC2597) TaxID=252305 RepID=A3TVS6_PSEBH|nr:I78 family peptidase inhibitor [Pseudooceanicola batsensis]EAQ03722.1 hypothetical protein OB2597_10781 [Pseudooceanicola batsensis HTCC2597]